MDFAFCFSSACATTCSITSLAGGFALYGREALEQAQIRIFVVDPSSSESIEVLPSALILPVFSLFLHDVSSFT